MTEDGLDLLDEAVATLRDRLAKDLTGEPRYLALLAANAVTTAAREARLGAPPARAPDAAEHLARAIRAGDRDGDAALFETLMRESARRAWIADPSALTQDERRRLRGDAPG